MEQSMQNKTLKIPFKTKRFGFECLIICGLGRDKNISEVPVISRKRQDVSRPVQSSVLVVIAPDHLICNKHNRERLARNAQFRDELAEKSTKNFPIDGMRPLLVNQEVAFSLRFRLFAQTEAIVAAQRFAWNTSHTLGRFVALADGARHPVR